MIWSMMPHRVPAKSCSARCAARASVVEVDRGAGHIEQRKADATSRAAEELSPAPIRDVALAIAQVRAADAIRGVLAAPSDMRLRGQAAETGGTQVAPALLAQAFRPAVRRRAALKGCATTSRRHAEAFEIDAHRLR